MPHGWRWCVLSLVHPHECGEHFFKEPPDFIHSGSSPRVWGTSSFASRMTLFFRFIPTSVGNMQYSPFRSQIKPVHPHECGEHSSQSNHQQAKCGSSPRVWGTFCGHTASRKSNRFIPTSVGNMLAVSSIFRKSSVHPHECGEHNIAGFSDENHLRFIPTSVGNMGAAPLDTSGNAVHPHECGEHEIPAKAHNLVIGSSPRVWGTCRRKSCCINGVRFIPTSVGNI